MKKTWPIEIDCPNCAAKLEAALAQLPGVEHARVDYVRKTVTLAAKEADFARLTQAMVDTARQIEPDAVIYLEGEGKPGHHHGEGCACILAINRDFDGAGIFVHLNLVVVLVGEEYRQRFRDFSGIVLGFLIGAGTERERQSRHGEKSEYIFHCRLGA